METIDAIKGRWGCRKYSDKSVAKELLGSVLDAGRFAPSAGNLQDRSFIVIKNEVSKEEISKICGKQDWMKTAPVHIVIVAENKKTEKFFGEKGKTVYPVQDTSFTAQNMLLEATDLGLGTSIVVGFDEGRLIDLLKIKEPAKPYAVITLGYPEEEPKKSTKYPLERFVFMESYGNRIENPALEFGEWGEVRKQVTEKVIKEVKRKGPGIIEKLKSLFRKKKPEEEPKEDHFLEEEIPRVLPKH